RRHRLPQAGQFLANRLDVLSTSERNGWPASTSTSQPSVRSWMCSPGCGRSESSQPEDRSIHIVRPCGPCGGTSKEKNMSHPEEYDVVVLGSGAPGKLLSWSLASQGKRVAVIERKYVGGACPNIACLPSKNVIHNAKVASYFRRSAEFGITVGD